MTCYNSYTYGQKQGKAGSLINLIFASCKSILNSPHLCSSLGVDQVLLCLFVSVWQRTLTETRRVLYCRNHLCVVQEKSISSCRTTRQGKSHAWALKETDERVLVRVKQWAVANVLLFARLGKSFQLLFYAHYHCDSDCASMLFQLNSRFTYLK